MNEFHVFRDKVKELVKVWNDVIKPGIEESGQYGETNTRKYLIDPILESLNWIDDGSKKIVDNEFAVKHKTGTGSADYALKINGVPKILLEAKDVAKVKDLENGYDMIHGIKRTYPRQLSNYCHDLNHLSFDIKFAILTNGKEWIIYNMQYADISSEREVVFRLDLEELDKPANLQKLWALEYNDFVGGYTRLREIIQQLHDYRLDIDKKAVQQLLECKDLLSSSILNDYEKDKRGIKSQIDNILVDKEKDNGMPTFQEIPEEERLNFFIKEASSSVINKVLFIRVLEDKNFLTPKLTKRSIEKWKDFWGHKDYREIMNLFREACRVTENTYNGGLFRLNPYDKVEYDPEVIKKIIDILGDINFREIDSDIIGRIYEIYLGQVLKVESEIRGKKRTKYKANNKERKKLGQYYTPKFVVDFIVKNTLGKLIKGKKPEDVAKIRILDPACGSGSFLINAYDTLVEYYENWNKEILKKIEEANKKEGAKLSRYQNNGSVPNYKNIILKDNIHGVDLNGLSVQIAEINLWLRALERDKKLIKLNKNILHGNSLVTGVETDEELATYKEELEEIKQRTTEIKDYYDKDELDYGEKNKLKALEAKLKVLREKINVKLNENLKDYFGEHFNKVHAFNWGVEFPQIMQEGGFDVVIGNPPYVQLSMEEYSSEGIKEYLLNKYESSMGRLNTFGFFIKLGIDLLKNKGKFAYIVPNTVLTMEYYEELREYILKTCRIMSIVSFENMPFEDAIVENVILVLEKNNSPQSREDNVIEIIDFKEKFSVSRKITQSHYASSYKKTFNVKLDTKQIEFKERIKVGSKKLQDLVNINQAIALKHDRAKYIFKEKKDSTYKPVLDGRDIGRYSIIDAGNFLKYEKDAIHSCKEEDIFLAKEKLFFRRVGEGLIVAYDNKQYYALNTLVVVTSKDESVNIKFILGLLNSKFINYYYNTYLKSTKKVFSEIQARQVGQLPIKENKRYSEYINQKVEKMLSLKNNFLNIIIHFYNSLSNQPITDTKYCKLAHYFDNYELYGMQRETSGRINEIKAKILSLNVKEEGDKLVIYMTNYNEEQKHLWKSIKALTLTINDEDVRKFLFFSIKKFINEKRGTFGTGNLLELIKKIEVPVYVANVKMNIDKIKAVMKEFNTNTKDLWFKDESKKDKFNSLTEMEAEVRKTDKEIDEMVYKLYGITEEEKKIIEESLR